MTKENLGSSIYLKIQIVRKSKTQLAERGRFQHKRSALGIESSEHFSIAHLFTINCLKDGSKEYEATNIKKLDKLL